MLRKNSLLIACYIVILLLLFYYQTQFSQIEISLWVNGLHSQLLDMICKYGTYAGDGLFTIIVGLFIFKFNPRLACCIILAYLVSAGLTQVLKHAVFYDLKRPGFHLEGQGIYNVHFIDGVEMNYENSFPSGHATSAFALFITLALFFESPSFKILALLTALFISFTRIYLLQHFLIDTIAGSVIGAATAFMVYFFVIQKGGYEKIKMPKRQTT